MGKNNIQKGELILPPIAYRVLTENEKQMKEGEALTSAIENLGHTISETIMEDMDTFRECGSNRTNKSPTFKHWLECLDLLQVLLIYIRAEREGDWLLHIENFVAMNMIPYFIPVTGKTTVLSLINAPGALQFFKRGMFIRGKFSMQKCSF